MLGICLILFIGINAANGVRMPGKLLFTHCEFGKETDMLNEKLDNKISQRLLCIGSMTNGGKYTALYHVIIFILCCDLQRLHV